MIRPFLILALVPLFLAAQEIPSAESAPPSATAPAPSNASAPVPSEDTPYVPGRFKLLFQPTRTDTAALSPDGKYIAYSIRENEAVSVVVIEIDHPETVKARVQVVTDDAATPILVANQNEKTPGRINWMGWVTPTRIVVETNQIIARMSGADTAWQSWRGVVLGFDADGSNARQLTNPEDLSELAEDTSDNAFSLSRKSTGFDSRVVTPDKPSAEALPPPPSEEEESEFGEPLPPNLGRSQPRTIRIFDFDPARPGAVILLATGSPREAGWRSIGFYSMDTLTGKMKELTNDIVYNTRSPLLDRQGHVRLTLPNSLLTPFPLRYEYLGPKGGKRPQPIEEATNLTGFSVSPDNYFGERSIPLGFDKDPNVLYYASNLGRDTYGIYSFDLTTKQQGKLAMENSVYDLISAPETGFPPESTLVYDRFQHSLVGIRYHNALRTTAWTRPEWKALQLEFEKKFPGRSVEITEWDESGKRFLVNTKGPADPGAFFVYDRVENKLFEFARRAPWIDANQVHLTLPFSYATADGSHISGLVTVPKKPLLTPIPMVVLCPDFPWQRVRSDFQSDVHALTQMGFVVVQLNGRGAWGLGLKQRQSLTAGYDLVQVEDIVTAVAKLGTIFNVNPKRVAVMGRGHGGFIAMRAIQDHPDKFRCAIALDPQVDLAGWLAEQKWSGDEILPHLTRAWLGDKNRLKAAPLTSHPEAITKPILILSYPGLDGAPRRLSYTSARSFAGSVRRHGAEVVDFKDLSTDYMNGLPAARAATFDEIEGFLNTHVYNYKVKIKDLKVIDKDVSKP